MNRYQLVCAALVCFGAHGPTLARAAESTASLGPLTPGVLALRWNPEGDRHWRLLRVKEVRLRPLASGAPEVRVRADVLFAGFGKGPAFSFPRRPPCGADPGDWDTSDQVQMAEGFELLDAAQTWVARSADRQPVFTRVTGASGPPASSVPALDERAWRWVRACEQEYASGARKGPPEQLPLALNAAAEDIPLRPLPSGLERVFVQADVANMRSAPVADAPVLRQLRIGATVGVLQRKPGWVRVGIATLRGMLSGWMGEALLSATAPALPQLLSSAESLEKGGKPAEAWALLERAVALAPDDRAVRARLATLGASLGRDVRAHQRHLDGTMPVLWAACVHSPARYAPFAPAAVVLLGESNGGAFTPLGADPDHTTATPAQQTALSRALVEPWWSLSGTGDGLRVLPGTFDGARLVEGVREERVGGQVVGAQVVLGPCTAPGTVFATVPLTAPTPARATPASNDVLARARQVHAPADGVRRTMLPDGSALLQSDANCAAGILDPAGGVSADWGFHVAPFPTSANERDPFACSTVAAEAPSAGVVVVVPLAGTTSEAGSTRSFVDLRLWHQGLWRTVLMTLAISLGC